MGDTSLITQIKTGDMVAARALYDAHAGRVYRIIYRMVGDQALAEDCVQETFIRVFDRIDSVRGESALGPWIYRVAVNVTLGALRSAKHRSMREVELSTEAARTSDGQEPADTGGVESDPHLRARLSKAIGELSDVYRLVFLMYDVEGYSHEEIGHILGISEGASKVRLTRARARLREALAELVDRRGS